MRSNVFSLIDTLLHIIPINNHQVMFSAFSDQYSDNPKWISIKMHEMFPDVKLVWVFSDRTNLEDVPEYIIPVRQYSLRHAIEKNRARVIIDNYTGIYSKFTDDSNSWKYKLLKKKHQINLSTWHGTPLKKIGRAIMNRGNAVFVTTTDGFIFNSEYIKNIFFRDFSDKVPAYLLGSARNDLLFETNEDKLVHTKEKLGLKKDKKYVLYAPTFRNTNRLDGDSYSLSLDTDLVFHILEALSNRFGGEWGLISRVHQKIKDKKTDLVDGTMIIDGNEHDDMAEYLATCDALITDYSGSLFDIANTDKPCFLYAPDYIHYRDKERGLYLDVNELPYTFAISEKELMENILTYDSSTTANKVALFNKKLGNIDDGKASERISVMINKIINDNM